MVGVSNEFHQCSRESSETETREHREAEHRSSRESATTEISGKETETKHNHVSLRMMKQREQSTLCYFLL